MTPLLNKCVCGDTHETGGGERKANVNDFSFFFASLGRAGGHIVMAGRLFQIIRVAPSLVMNSSVSSPPFPMVVLNLHVSCGLQVHCTHK